jgi:hypothetical protein
LSLESTVVLLNWSAMSDRPPGGGSNLDAVSGKRTFRNGVAQVDVCPGEVGLILSIGRVSLWVNTDEALDAARALARALEHLTAAGASPAPDEPAIDGVLAPPFPIREG